jgi:hypothetical protein
MHTDIHASSEIRSRDSSYPAGEDSSCLRPSGNCNRHNLCIYACNKYCITGSSLQMLLASLSPQEGPWCILGRAIAQAVSRQFPTAVARDQIMWSLYWTKWHWGRFPRHTSISFGNSHPTDCSRLNITIPNWYSRPNSGRRINWTVSPHPTKENSLFWKFNVVWW